MASKYILYIVIQKSKIAKPLPAKPEPHSPEQNWPKSVSIWPKVYKFDNWPQRAWIVDKLTAVTQFARYGTDK